MLLGQARCSETSLNFNHLTLRNNQKLYILIYVLGKSLKSHIIVVCTSLLLLLRMELIYGDSEGNLKHRIYGQALKVFVQDTHCDKKKYFVLNCYMTLATSSYHPTQHHILEKCDPNVSPIPQIR